VNVIFEKVRDKQENVKKKTVQFISLSVYQSVFFTPEETTPENDLSQEGRKVH
jgi:hypothetical protein